MASTDQVDDPEHAPPGDGGEPDPIGLVDSYMAGSARETPIHDRASLVTGNHIAGPAIIRESTGTTIVEPGWRASVTALDHLVLERVEPLPRRTVVGTDADPWRCT